MKIGRLEFKFTKTEARTIGFSLLFVLLFIACCHYVFDYCLVPTVTARDLANKIVLLDKKIDKIELKINTLTTIIPERKRFK